jgi:hypothetical protein
MKNVIKIIMARDNMSFDDAKELVTDCRDAIIEALETGDDPEEILAQELGLEPDYLFDLI